MTNFTSSYLNQLTGPNYGQPLVNRAKSNQMNGRIRYAEFTYVAPSSGTAPAIADKIIFGKLPPKSRVLGHLSRLSFTTGTASCTLNLGDSTLAARHLAATAITTAGNATPEAANVTTTCVADITLNSATIVNILGVGALQPGDIVTGTGIPTATTVLSVDYGNRTAVMSALATATNAAVTVTSNGGGYETQDDSATAANNWTSTTDDCTLIGVVAGAQVANNQVITLKVAYVQD